MNKLLTVVLAILGGIDVTIYIVTPILISAIWINIATISTWNTYIFIVLGVLATLFRAIKVGFLKREDD